MDSFRRQHLHSGTDPTLQGATVIGYDSIGMAGSPLTLHNGHVSKTGYDLLFRAIGITAITETFGEIRSSRLPNGN
jgi:hypothetical protein